MTEDQNAVEKQRMTPVIAALAATVVLAGLLAVGGISAAGAMATPRVPAQAQPSSTTGVDTPVEDPSTPPDRDSDQSVEPPPADTIYNIQRGDTLTSISAKLGVSVDAIAEYNAVRDINVISEGAVLRLPYIYIPPVVGQ